MIETLSTFGKVSSVRSREAVSSERTLNEDEMQAWTQRTTDRAEKFQS